MANDRLIITRRGFWHRACGRGGEPCPAAAAAALNVDQARALVGKAIGEVNSHINSGKSASAMYGDFERIFSRYADVPVIARSALGPTARNRLGRADERLNRRLSGLYRAQIRLALPRIHRGEIEVTARGASELLRVISVAKLRGQAPFDLRWHVSDKSGKTCSSTSSSKASTCWPCERTEIGAMLDKRGGDLDGLIADLKPPDGLAPAAVTCKGPVSCRAFLLPRRGRPARQALHGG